MSTRAPPVPGPHWLLSGPSSETTIGFDPSSFIPSSFQCWNGSRLNGGACTQLLSDDLTSTSALTSLPCGTVTFSGLMNGNAICESPRVSGWCASSDFGVGTNG